MTLQCSVKHGKEVMKTVLRIFICLLFLAPVIFAATTDALSPRLVVNNASIGSESWSNPSRANQSDNSKATVEIEEGDVSHYLKATNFSFILPATAVIGGIMVDVERSVSSVGGGSVTRDAAVRLVKAEGIGTADRATTTAYTTTDTYESHGGSNDLWNTTWTASDIMHAQFGTVIAVTTDSDDDKTARIDHIRITVTYNTPPTIALLAPNNDEHWNGTQTVQWVASDPDNDSLSITIQASADNLTWITLTSNESNDGSFLWNTSMVPDNASYRVRVNASDGFLTNQDDSNNTFVVDNTPPIITLFGANVPDHPWDTTYTDAGATAHDAIDGNRTTAILTTNTVITSMLGSYAVTYQVNDTTGNPTIPVVRNVTVRDTIPPLIQLIGSDIDIVIGTGYTDSGATASDNYNGDITLAIVVINTVNANGRGSYTVTYTVNDSSGNAALPVTRNVTVVAYPDKGAHYPSLGPDAFSYFARPPGALPPGTAFATVTTSAPAASPTTTAAPTAGPASRAPAGDVGEARSATTTGVSTAPVSGGENTISGRATLGSPGTITGAVIGTHKITPLRWAALLGIVALILLAITRHRHRNAEHMLKEFLQQWKR